MSKNIYTLRETDGRLMKFDGSIWALQGSYDPLTGTRPYFWPMVAIPHERQCSFFEYNGSLYTVWKGVTTGGNWTLNVCKYVSGDLIEISNFVVAGQSYTYDVLSNWVNYKGKMYAVQRERETPNLLLITFDGTTITRTQITSMPNVGTVTSTYIQSIALNLFVHDDKLFVGGRSIFQAISFICKNTVSRIDITGSVVTSTTNYLIDANINQELVGVSYTESYSRQFDAMSKCFIHNFSLNGKLYGINAFGEVNELNDSLERTFKFDIRDAAIMQRGTFTITNGDPGRQPIQFGSYGAISPWYPMCTGSKITHGSNVGNVLGMDQSYEDKFKACLLNGTIFPEVATGQQVTVTYSICPCLNVYGKISSQAVCHISTEIINNVAYICVTGRNALSNAIDNASGTKSFMIRYDGVNAPTYYELLDGGLKPNVWNMATCVDRETNQIHLITINAYDNTEHHYIFNTGDNTWTVIGNFAPVYVVPEDRQYLTPNAIIAFNENDGTSTIIDAVANQSGTNITITYQLFSADSHAINIAVEYDIGNGYVNATEVGGGQGKTNLTSSPAGTTHTFIHNVGFDLPLRSGTIMYRITILP